jgi:hypothetical protein
MAIPEGIIRREAADARELVENPDQYWIGCATSLFHNSEWINPHLLPAGYSNGPFWPGPLGADCECKATITVCPEHYRSHQLTHAK